MPQRAVSDLQGGHQVVVVNAENQADIRPVKVGERTGSLWIIDEGLKRGDRVVVEGFQKVKAGQTVTPKPVLPEATDRTTGTTEAQHPAQTNAAP